ncbi:MAG: hypothetical protein N2578_08345 [Bdellovibrionaceae bacterium]|nr:hypothetical protein [Pseudobdellovibrionaceae bacterium]
MVAHAGLLLSQVQYVKKTPYKNFLILDTGMHHLIRPALYGARHQILPVHRSLGQDSLFDVVGPICESTDFLGKDIALPDAKPGDFIAIADAGAYGIVMSSRYNLQTEPLEVAWG